MHNKVIKPQQNSLTAHLRGIASGKVTAKEQAVDCTLVKALKAIMDGKAAPTGPTVEKGPPLAPHYPGVGVPPIYQAPPSEKQKDKSRLDITDRFYLANQNYSKRTRRL